MSSTLAFALLLADPSSAATPALAPLPDLALRLDVAAVQAGPPPAPLAPGASAPLQATPPPAPAPPAADTPPAPPLSAPASGDDQEIVVNGRRHDPGDPFEKINAQSFAVTQAVDAALVRPVAKAYQSILPAPARDGIRNFLLHLREPIVFINFLLQFHVGKAAETLARFTVNSTVGVAGLFDVARRKPFKLPRRQNGFADTLGYYGVKTGVFMYLPIVGPTTVRDLVGSTIDRFVLPFAIGGPFKNPAVTIPAGVLGTVDHRAQFDETLEELHRNTPDAYVASREFYLARRQAEIDELRGKGHREVRPQAGSNKPTISIEPRQ